MTDAEDLVKEYAIDDYKENFGKFMGHNILNTMIENVEVEEIDTEYERDRGEYNSVGIPDRDVKLTTVSARSGFVAGDNEEAVVDVFDTYMVTEVFDPDHDDELEDTEVSLENTKIVVTYNDTTSKFDSMEKAEEYLAKAGVKWLEED